MRICNLDYVENRISATFLLAGDGSCFIFSINRRLGDISDRILGVYASCKRLSTRVPLATDFCHVMN